MVCCSFETLPDGSEYVDPQSNGVDVVVDVVVAVGAEEYIRISIENFCCVSRA